MVYSYGLSISGWWRFVGTSEDGSLEKNNWLSIAFRAKGSVVPSILPRVMFCSAFAALICLLYYYKLPVANKSLANAIPAIVLGLLLVFRTNTAYERFWEGRKAWGTINNSVRNLSRQIWLAVEERRLDDRERKVAVLRLLPAYAIAMKLHLRGQSVMESPELAVDLSPAQLAQLAEVQVPPLEIAFWVGEYLQLEQRRGTIGLYQMNELQGLIGQMVDMLGACERILRTPIPMAYAIHLKQLLLIYSLLLPSQLVLDLGWWTVPVVGLVSFTLFGIEAIGMEIENPFGSDPNDLPLDTICAGMQRTIEDTIKYAGYEGLPRSIEVDVDVN
jgi:ion channel-forming bestrophin family protein